MDWGLVLSYSLGVPAIALLVGAWWLAHFANAWTVHNQQLAGKGGQGTRWSWVRKATFWASAIPFLLPGVADVSVWVVGKVLRRIMAEGAAEAHSVVTLAIANGVVWGVAVVTLVRVTILVWSS